MSSLFCLVLATSGIDYDIKVWAPVLQEAVTLNGVDEVCFVQCLSFLPHTITVPSCLPGVTKKYKRLNSPCEGAPQFKNSYFPFLV